MKSSITNKDQEKAISKEDRQYYFDQWKHFEEAGGKDKNRMINLATWLLTFIAGILGYAFTHPAEPGSNERLVMGIVVLFIALITLTVVLSFNYYANFNWRAAEKIESEYLPELKAHINSIAKGRYSPTSSKIKMARVFIIFLLLAVLGGFVAIDLMFGLLINI